MMESPNSPLIFLIDPNPLHNSLIKYHLNANRFFRVQSFISGDECLYRLQKHGVPDFIILDYDIGDHTGFDFMTKIHAISAGINLIFFSSFDDPVLAVRLMDAGAADFIAKTGRLDIGIRELIRNIGYLYKTRNQTEKK